MLHILHIYTTYIYYNIYICSDVLEIIKKSLAKYYLFIKCHHKCPFFCSESDKNRITKEIWCSTEWKKYSEKDYFIVRIRFEKEYKRKHSLREINLLEKHCHWDANVFYLKSKGILKDKGNIPKVSFPFKFFICFNDRGGGA